MLDRFPGFLGYGGIIAIHADWPMYPSGIGWEVALRALGNFPKDTKFFEVDDIDRCKLLIYRKPKNESDGLESSDYQVCAWHEDLIKLSRLGLISGPSEVTEFEFDLHRFNQLKNVFGAKVELDNFGNLIFYTKDENGKLVQRLYHKPLEQNYEDQGEFRDLVLIPEYVEITESGYQKLTQLASESKIGEELNGLTAPLISLNRFDTAIREASLLLEINIKKLHNKPSLFGHKLIDHHIKDVIRRNDNFNSASIKCYRGELRTAFKFVRNDFAHNFRVLTLEQCKLILNRINDVLEAFHETVEVFYK